MRLWMRYHQGGGEATACGAVRFIDERMRAGGCGRSQAAHCVGAALFAQRLRFLFGAHAFGDDRDDRDRIGAGDQRGLGVRRRNGVDQVGAGDGKGDGSDEE